jgi:hypothetical protein
MNLNRLLCLAAYTLVLAPLATPVARASSRIADPASTFSAPPAYPDAAHVRNGCHLSSIRFLNRFLAEYPAEHGQTLVVTMRNADGSTQAHTIALISWQGQAWCRDEYYGVFSLGCAAETNPNLERLSARAERKLEKHAQLMVSTGQAGARSEPPAHLSAEQNLRDVTVAAKLIPYATTIFWVRCGNQERPMAFFRPTGKCIAVYDPEHGTSTAGCACTDDAKIVLLVASRLGYRAQSVRAELPVPQASLLASADTAPAGVR